MSTPLHFGPDDRPLFGQLHPAAAPGRLGLVVVAPFGYEAICAHRTLRHLAEASAAAGVATLRFDLDGTGDSAGDDLDPDRVAAWIASANAAADALRRFAGVERIAFLGVRLGALIAAQTAIARDDVEALVAIAPVVSGRAHVREMKVLQAALGLPASAPGSAPPDGDLQEAVGFALTAATRAALSAIDLAKEARPPAPHVLILDRADLPGAERWAARLAAAGARVDARQAGGYVEMMLDPHKSTVPAEVVAAVASWLAGHNAARPERALPVEGRPAAVSSAVCERPVAIDGGGFGILAEPAVAAARTGRAILLLNSGSVHHVGPNRLWVTLARRWAALGHVALRVDLTGIGDAPTRPGETENTVYGPRALDDVAAAVARLRAEPGIRDVRALGLCSGAYHAFKAAVAGQPLDGVVVINPLTFFWHEGESLEIPPYKVAGDVDRYTKNVLRADSWKKLLRGEVDVRRAVKSVGRHAATVVATRARDVSRRVGMPWREDLGAELEAIVRRTIDLRFVFASDDPGLTLLRAQAGSALPSLHARGALSIAMIDGPDHTFTPLWSHDILARTLGAILDGPAA